MEITLADLNQLTMYKIPSVLKTKNIGKRERKKSLEGYIFLKSVEK
jgi:hypothetical protein